MIKRSLLALAVGCAALGAISPAQSAPAKEEIRVGVILSLSGPASFLGSPIENSMKMLVEDINKRGGLEGHPLKVTTYDTEGNSTKAVQLYRRLVDSDHVQVVFGPNTSGEAIALVPVANQAKVPFVAMAGAEPIVSPVTKYVFKIPPTDRVVVSSLLQEFNKRHIKNVAMIRSTDGYGQSGETMLKELAPKYGMNIVRLEQFGPRDPSMTTQLIRIRDSKPDAVVVWSVNPGPTIILKEAKAVGLKSPIFNSFGVASKKLIDQAGAASEGSYVISPRILVPESLPNSNTQKKNLIRFANDFAKRYNTPIDSFSAHPFDAMLLLDHALKTVKGPVTADAIATGLETVRACGANGCFHMSAKDHNGLGLDAMGLYQVVNGKWVLAK